MSVPVVRIKDGVTFKMGLPAGIRILAAIYELAFYLGQDVTITGGAEGHEPDTPHGRGEAYDIRTVGHDDQQIKRMFLFLRNELGPLFTVLYERKEDVADGSPLAGLVTVNPKATGQHLHLQTKKGTIYPPSAV